MPIQSQNSHFKARMTFLRVFRGEIVTDSVIRGDQGFKRPDSRTSYLKMPVFILQFRDFGLLSLRTFSLP